MSDKSKYSKRKKLTYCLSHKLKNVKNKKDIYFMSLKQK